ncbi:unnamed protein product [Boreogadus saida]
MQNKKGFWSRARWTQGGYGRRPAVSGPGVGTALTMTDCGTEAGNQRRWPQCIRYRWFCTRSRSACTRHHVGAAIPSVALPVWVSSRTLMRFIKSYCIT